MRNKDVIIYFLLLLFLSVNSFAAERYEFYTGARQMGMGGATIAVVNDETALVQNPAALGKLREKYLTLIDPEVHMGSETTEILSDEDYDFTKIMDPQDQLTILNSNPDKRLHTKFQLFPSLVFPNFGVGLLISYNYDSIVDSTANEFQIRYRNDDAAIIGYNFRFFDGIIKLGFNAKYINRVEVEDELPTTSTGLEWKNIVSEGVGISSDVALMMTGPWQYLPTIAAVWRDVGDTTYSMGGGMFYSGRPEPTKTKSTLDVGASISPIMGKYSRMQLVAELRDVMTDDDEEVVARRLHYGLEFNFFDKLFVRGGMNQGYWTTGLEVASENMQFQLAYYGEEIGTKDAEKEDRRYIFKFALRF